MHFAEDRIRLEAGKKPLIQSRRLWKLREEVQAREGVYETEIQRSVNWITIFIRMLERDNIDKFIVKEI